MINNCVGSNEILVFPSEEQKPKEVFLDNMIDGPKVLHGSECVLGPLQNLRMRRQFRLKPKQTLTDLLSPLNLGEKNIFLIAQMMKPYIDPRKLQPGQKIDVRVDGEQMLSLSMNFEFDNKLTLIRVNDNWKISTQKLPVEVYQSASKGIIEDNLYESLIKQDGKENKTPMAIYHQFVTLMSYYVDFQRDIKPGDTYSLVYTTESLRDNSAVTKTGVVFYAELKLKNRTVRLYRYEVNGEENYYDEFGNQVGSFLIKTPVKSGVLSSHYGQRKHPILNYTRMHKGIDFSAPVGTPIIAAGKGKVIRAGWSNSFGNLVKIQHSNDYQTLYAHLQKISPKIKYGKQVKQGEIIGYLGSTGLTAGRHLHYEIHKGGRAINPTLVKESYRVALNKQQLRKFKTHIESLNLHKLAR